MKNTVPTFNDRVFPLSEDGLGRKLTIFLQRQCIEL